MVTSPELRDLVLSCLKAFNALISSAPVRWLSLSGRVALARHQKQRLILPHLLLSTSKLGGSCRNRCKLIFNAFIGLPLALRHRRRLK